MIYVGIDISEDKHDCHIVTAEGETLAEVFIIANRMDGFIELFSENQIRSTRFE